MNIHSSFTDVMGDPLAALHREDARRQLPLVTKLIRELTQWQTLVLDRTRTGRMYSDEDHSRLSVAETFAELEQIDEGNLLHDHIRTLRFQLGLAE